MLEPTFQVDDKRFSISGKLVRIARFGEEAYEEKMNLELETMSNSDQVWALQTRTIPHREMKCW